MTDGPFVGYPGSVALDRGDAAAVVMASDGATLSYTDLDLRSTRLARLLREHGMRPGGHLALMMGNESRFLEVCWAALRSGLYCTPISPKSTVEEATYIVADAGATDLIVGSAQQQLGLEVRGRVTAVRGVIAVDGSRVGLEDYEAIVSTGPTTPLDSQTEGAMLLYSSGTTGRPKGVERPLSGRPPGSSNPMAPFMPRLQLSESSVFLCPGPLYHAAPVGFSLAVQRVGGTVVLMERFDARDVLAAIERFKVTHMQLVPTMMVRLLRLPVEVRDGFDLSSLQRIVHAAAPCPPHVKREFIEWLGPIVDEYYSGTEGSGITYVTSPEWLAHPGTVGRPIFGEVHIVDAAGASLGPGEVGAVYFGKGYNYVYRNDPAATEARVGPSGWTTLDDMGYVDEDGYLYLTDRRSHTIVVGGVNVFPREVEDVLLTHPAVADVAVIGVPDEEYGEQVKAVVVLEPPAVLSPELVEELIAHCRAALSAVKCPRSVDVADSLPRDESGKLRKAPLREQYWSGHPTRI